MGGRYFAFHKAQRKAGKRLTSESKLTVRYAETDQMGIAHHSVYPVWYEVGRTEFIRALGIGYNRLEKMGAMLPVLEVHCKYIHPVEYEDELCIHTRIGSMGAAKIQFEYTIYKCGCEKPVNIGTTLHGWVDSQTFRPINLKKKFPDVYQMIAAAADSDDSIYASQYEK